MERILYIYLRIHNVNDSGIELMVMVKVEADLLEDDVGGHAVRVRLITNLGLVLGLELIMSIVLGL